MADFGVTEYIAISAAVISAATAAAGTGLEMYSQQQQADNATAMANYNYQLQQRNAEISSKIAAQQSQWQQQALANNAITQQNNATALEQQGRAAEAQARAEADRKRMENERLLASQRARYGKAGVVNEGTPLAVMAETAGLLELGVQDAHYQADMTGRAYDRQAELARLDAKNSLFDEGVAKYQGAAQQAGIAIDLSKAEVDRVAGLNTAQGYRTASYGTLISGAGNTVSGLSDNYDRMQRNQYYKTH